MKNAAQQLAEDERYFDEMYAGMDPIEALRSALTVLASEVDTSTDFGLWQRARALAALKRAGA